MKLAILTCGILPIPAVQGGAVENLIDFYLDYNNIHKLHDITVYSPWDDRLANHPALKSDVNHYIFIDVTSPSVPKRMIFAIPSFTIFAAASTTRLSSPSQRTIVLLADLALLRSSSTNDMLCLLKKYIYCNAA